MNVPKFKLQIDNENINFLFEEKIPNELIIKIYEEICSKYIDIELSDKMINKFENDVNEMFTDEITYGRLYKSNGIWEWKVIKPS